MTKFCTKRRNVGRHVSRHISKNKKGGYWGTVINQAVVPLSILGIAHSYKYTHHQQNNHKATGTRRRPRGRGRSFRSKKH